MRYQFVDFGDGRSARGRRFGPELISAEGSDLLSEYRLGVGLFGSDAADSVLLWRCVELETWLAESTSNLPGKQAFPAPTGTGLTLVELQGWPDYCATVSRGGWMHSERRRS